MAHLLLSDLDPQLLAQLERLAKQHGRSLQEQVHYLLQQAIQKQLTPHRTFGDAATAKAAITRSQARYAGQTFSDSVELIREDRER